MRKGSAATHAHVLAVTGELDTLGDDGLTYALALLEHERATGACGLTTRRAAASALGVSRAIPRSRPPTAAQGSSEPPDGRPRG